MNTIIKLADAYHSFVLAFSPRSVACVPKKSPVLSVLEEGATEPLILAESGAIVEFLLERYGKGKLQVPADATDYKQRASYLMWMHWAEVSAAGAGVR